jgi:hypothetical protein
MPLRTAIITRRYRVVAGVGVVVALVAGCSPSAERPALVERAPGRVAPSTSAPPVQEHQLPPTTAPVPPTTVELPPGQPPCGVRAVAPPVYAHVVWIWMENKRYGNVIGDVAAPYETALAGQCGTDRNYRQVGRPSLPNYLGATSGDTYGIADDAGPSAHPVANDNIFRQVRAATGTARSYVEDMPSNCASAAQGKYAVKHNPAAYYVGGSDHVACLADDVPMGTTTSGALRADIDGNRLPTFALVVPNICDDGHDCSASTGDHWLATWLPLILNSGPYRSGDTAIFIVWDESTPIPNIVISPTTTPGLVTDAPVDHYALLRTTEEMLGLPLLGRAQSAVSLRQLFRL